MTLRSSARGEVCWTWHGNGSLVQRLKKKGIKKASRKLLSSLWNLLFHIQRVASSTIGGQFSTFKQTLSVHFAVERHENRLRTWDSSFASRCAGSSSGEGVADREVGKWWNSLSSCCLEGIGVPLQLLELSPLFMQVGKWPHVSGNDRFRGMQFPFQWVLHFYYQLHVWRS